MAIYKLNEAKMFADITDNVAIIINSETGIYYGMNGFGTAVFENLIKGIPSEVILEKMQSLPNVFPEIETRFNLFVKAITEKGLVILGDEACADEVVIDYELATKDNFALEVSEYNDAQELLLADPIHEVREETGWSPEKAALNPDLEDVARRESKMG